MSVQTRSIIWGLPQFQKPITESIKNSDNDKALDQATLKSDRRSVKKVSKILVQLTKTQSILVDYTNDQPNSIQTPNAVKNKWPTASVPTLSSSPKKIIDTINTNHGDAISLKMPNWSLSQTKLRFIGYLNNQIEPNQGHVGDFYLRVNGDILLREVDGWKRIPYNEFV